MAPNYANLSGDPRRISYRNGGYRYENPDGSTYYNDGHGFEEFRHPDRSRSWKHHPDHDAGPDSSRTSYISNHDGDGYHYDEDDSEVEAFVDGQGDVEMMDAGYGHSENDEPPPYHEIDPLRSPIRVVNSQTITKALPRAPKTAGTASLSKPTKVAPKAKAAAKPSARQAKPTAAIAKAGKPTSKPKAKPKKSCSQCRVSGHDARNCPLNQVGLGKKQNAKAGYRETNKTTTTTTTVTTTTKSTKAMRGTVAGRVDKKKSLAKK